MRGLQIFIFLIATLGLFSCATTAPRAGSQELDAEQIRDFEARLRGTVLQELRVAGASGAVIHELHILSSHRQDDGSIQFAYHLDYDTTDPEFGQVSHRLDARATVAADIYQVSDNEQIVVWKLLDTTPPDQSLIFHDPLVIESKRKPAAGNESH